MSLALSGAYVVMANRNVLASEKLREQICGEAKGFTPKIDIVQLDLSSLNSVRNAANDFISKQWPLHVLILNAESAPSRLVIVSSSLHARTRIRASESLNSKLHKLESIPNSTLSPFFLYSNSKLCNVLVAKKAHKLVNDKGVNVYVLHPGIIRTELGRDQRNLYAVFAFFLRPFMRNVEQGAATTVYCAAHPDVANVRF
ncbi:WW domain-containing oxidoreductase [Ditylenchus destructor]|uniref:WW domain-containing oxidoreductase n=1 Tax=Ditylenchus destructor TaxID=166010 RepID=A0AAD4MJ34_9BILA|nr:WW domain-containing oxidoreductase [Ditylenchus destructor]